MEQARGTEPFSAEILEAASGLEGQALRRFEATWRQLSADRRLELLDQFYVALQEDYSLDAIGLCTLGFEDAEAEVRERAFTLAGEDGSVQLYDRLLRAAGEEPDREARMAAIESLGTFTLTSQTEEWPDDRWEPAHELLLEQIRQSRADPVMRAAALLSLAYLPTPEAEQEIRLAYADPSLKEAAIEAMGHNCQEIWYGQLRDELKSDDASIRLTAVLAVAEMEDERLVRDIVPRTQDDDEEVKLAAIGALGIIGGDDAEDILTQLEHSLDPDVQEAAVLALHEARALDEIFDPGLSRPDYDEDEDPDDGLEPR
jgi:HEAT repeat protein